MLVQNLIGSRADNTVISLTPEASIADAAGLLSEKRIGAVIVSKDGKTVNGILSERDIVRELGRRGASCLTMKVGEVMTSSPVCCTPADTVDKIREDMTSGGFRHMPVVVDGAVVAVISSRDVVRARIAELAFEREAMQKMIMGH